MTSNMRIRCATAFKRKRAQRTKTQMELWMKEFRLGHITVIPTAFWTSFPVAYFSSHIHLLSGPAISLLVFTQNK